MECLHRHPHLAFLLGPVSARDYVKKILVDKLRIKKVIVGHDFSFARKKEGNPEKLIDFGKEYNFGVEIVTPVLLNGKRVSSTDIRTLISNGDVAGAKKLLGQYYCIEGIVYVGCRKTYSPAYLPPLHNYTLYTIVLSMEKKLL